MRALASLGGKSLPPSHSDFSDRLLMKETASIRTLLHSEYWPCSRWWDLIACEHHIA